MSAISFSECSPLLTVSGLPVTACQELLAVRKMYLKNFRTYKLAVEFYRDCEAIRCKPYFRDQLSRSTLSVVNNLAEGSAKMSIKDRARFYEIALASFRESMAMLDAANKQELLTKYDVLGACLYKLHRSTLVTATRPPGTE